MRLNAPGMPGSDVPEGDARSALLFEVAETTRSALDAALVVIEPPRGRHRVEAWGADEQVQLAQEWRAALGRLRGLVPWRAERSVLGSPSAEAELVAAVVPFAGDGRLVALVDRAEFPTPSERVLLEALARQAAAVAVENDEAPSDPEANAVPSGGVHEWAPPRLLAADPGAALLRISSAGTVIWANQTAAGLLGDVPDDVRGHHLAEYAVDPPQLERLLSRALRGEAVSDQYLQLRAPAGGVTHAEITLVLSGDGGTPALSCRLRDVTDWWEAEDALARERERLELAMLAGRIWTWEWSVATRTLVAPGLIEDVLGDAPESPVGDWFFSLIHPAERDALRSTLARSLESSEPCEQEFRLVLPGRVRWLELRAQVVREAVGTVTGLRGVVVDITERRQAQQRLAAEHAVNLALAERAAGEAVLDGVLGALGQQLDWERVELWLPEPDGKRMARARGWCSAFSAPRFDAQSEGMAFSPGEGVPGLVWGDGSPIWMSDVRDDPRFVRMEAARLDGLRGGVAIPVGLPDGDRAVIVALGQHALEPDGELLATLAVVGNQISSHLERRRTDGALSESAGRLQAALDVGALGSWEWDFESGRIVWSAGLAGLYRLPAGEAIESIDRLMDMIHPDDRPELERLVGHAAEWVGDSRLEFRVTRADGSTGWFETRAHPLPGPDGRSTGARGVTIDITRHKELERELRHHVRRQAAIASLGARVLVVQDSQRLIAEVARVVADGLEAELACVLRHSPDGDLVLQACAGSLEAPPAAGAPWSGAHSAAALALHEGVPVSVPDYATDSGVDRAPALAAWAPRASISVPVGGSGRAVGVIEAYSAGRREFPLEDVSFMQLAAAMLQGALERAESRGMSDLMGALGEILQKSPDRPELLPEVASAMTSSFADWCELHVLDESGRIQLEIDDVRPERVPALRSLRQRQADGAEDAQAILQSQQPLLVPDLDRLERSERGAVESVAALTRGLREIVGPCSLMVLPLLAGGRVHGAMVLGREHRRGEPYRAREEQAGLEISRRIAGALENARLYREMREAVRSSREISGRYEDLVTGLDGIVWEAELAPFRFCFVSERSRGITGYAPAEWAETGDGWLDRVRPDRREDVGRRWREALEASNDFEIDFPIRTADGSDVWLHHVVRFTADDPDTPSRIVGLTLDVTAERALQESLAERQRQQAAVADLGRLALQLEGSDEFLQVLVDTVQDTLRVPFVSIVERSEGETGFVRRATVAHDAMAVGELIPEHPEMSLVGYTMASDAPVIVPDLGIETRFATERLLRRGIASCLSVPVRQSSRAYGMLGVYASEPRRFTPDDIAFLRSVAALLGAAVDRWRAEESLADRSRQQQAVSDLGVLALETEDLDEVFGRAAPLVAEVLGVEFVKILELRPAAGELFLRAGLGWREGLVGRATIPADNSQAGYTLAESTPIVVDHLQSDERLRGVELLREHGVTSGVSVVIHSDDGPYGVLGAHAKTRRRFNADDVHFLQSVANVLAGAVDRHLAREDERFLTEVSSVLFASLDYERALADVARRAVPRLGDIAMVHATRGDGAVEGIHVAHADPALRSTIARLRRLDSFLGAATTEVAQSGEETFYPAITPELEEALGVGEEQRSLLRSAGVTSALMVPLQSRGRTVGVLTLAMASSGRRYNRRDRALAHELAVRAATAVENARLYWAAQEALGAAEAAEERYRDIVQGVEAILWAADLQPGFHYTFFGAQVEALLGYPASRWLEQPDFWAEIMLPDELEGRRRWYAAAAANGDDCDMEFRARTAEGEWRWLRDIVRPIRDEDGRVSSMRGVIVDATWRRRLEDELREQAETVQLIAEVNRLLSAQLDLDALLQAVTDAATQLTRARFGAFFYNAIDEEGESSTFFALAGLDRSAFQAYPLPRGTELFGPTYRGEATVRLDDVTADRRFGQNAPYYGMPEGHPPVRSYLAVPVVSPSGEPLGGLFFGHEEPGIFTARDEEIAEGIAAQSAIAIDNARLYREAREAIEVRDRFLSIAAHELRTPLTTIKGYVHLFGREVRRDEPRAQRMRELTGDLDRQVARFEALISDLLDATRIRQGRLVLNRSPVDVCALAAAVVDRVRHLPQRVDGHRFELDAPEPLIGDWDPDRLDQVLTNLVSNAVKYSPGGGVVRVAVRRAGDDAMISVEDEGMGIADEDLERIFEPFSRASRGRGIEGTGLGLHITAELVRQHGGTITVESSVGKGSRFVVCIPLRRSSAGPPPHAGAEI